MRTFAALVLLFSAQAFACPNLTGSFTCRYDDGSSEIVNISQENKNGVMTYNYNGSEIPADNNVYPVPDDQSLREATFRAWCEGVSLKGQLLGKYYNEGSYYGDLTLNLDMSIDNGALKNVTTGNLKNSGGEYPIDSQVVCTRN